MSTIGALAVGFRAAREAKARARNRSAAKLRVSAAALAAKIAQAAGTIAGLGCLVAAAWTVALPLGLLAAGLSAFVLEWRLTE